MFFLSFKPYIEKKRDDFYVNKIGWEKESVS